MSLLAVEHFSLTMIHAGVPQFTLKQTLVDASDINEDIVVMRENEWVDRLRALSLAVHVERPRLLRLKPPTRVLTVTPTDLRLVMIEEPSASASRQWGDTLLIMYGTRLSYLEVDVAYHCRRVIDLSPAVRYKKVFMLSCVRPFIPIRYPVWRETTPCYDADILVVHRWKIGSGKRVNRYFHLVRRR